MIIIKCLGAVIMAVAFQSNFIISETAGNPINMSFTSFSEIEEYCMILIQRPIAEIWELNRKELQSFYACLQMHVDSLFFENSKLKALLDISERIEMFFIECWPSWGGPRNRKDHTPECWRIILLNFEHQLVVLLKTAIRKMGITEDFFIQRIAVLDELRNRKAHQTLVEEDLEKNYRYLRMYYKNSTARTAIEAFISIAENLFTLEISSPWSNSEAELKQMKNETDENRSAFKLLRIKAKALPVDVEEEDITRVVNELINEYGLRTRIKIPFPILAIVSHDAFLLFEGFEDAYSIREMYINKTNVPADNFLLLDVQRDRNLSQYNFITAQSRGKSLNEYLSLGPLNSYKQRKLVKEQTIVYIYDRTKFEILFKDYDIIRKSLPGYFVQIAETVKGLKAGELLRLSTIAPTLNGLPTVTSETSIIASETSPTKYTTSAVPYRISYYFRFVRGQPYKFVTIIFPKDYGKIAEEK